MSQGWVRWVSPMTLRCSLDAAVKPVWTWWFGCTPLQTTLLICRRLILVVKMTLKLMNWGNRMSHKQNWQTQRVIFVESVSARKNYQIMSLSHRANVQAHYVTSDWAVWKSGLRANVTARRLRSWIPTFGRISNVKFANLLSRTFMLIKRGRSGASWITSSMKVLKTTWSLNQSHRPHPKQFMSSISMPATASKSGERKSLKWESPTSVWVATTATSSWTPTVSSQSRTTTRSLGLWSCFASLCPYLATRRALTRQCTYRSVGPHSRWLPSQGTPSGSVWIAATCSHAKGGHKLKTSSTSRKPLSSSQLSTACFLAVVDLSTRNFHPWSSLTMRRMQLTTGHALVLRRPWLPRWLKMTMIIGDLRWTQLPEKVSIACLPLKESVILKWTLTELRELFRGDCSQTRQRLKSKKSMKRKQSLTS